jgi:hypothetical protein
VVQLLLGVVGAEAKGIEQRHGVLISCEASGVSNTASSEVLVSLLRITFRGGL